MSSYRATVSPEIPTMPACPSDGPLPVAFPGAFIPVSRADAARILGVSMRTLENWQKSGEMPKAGEIGGRVYWHPRIFHEWLEARLLPKSLMSDAPAGADPSLCVKTAKKQSSSPERLQVAGRAMSRNSELLAKMAAGTL